MHLEYDIKYLRSKKKISKKTGIDNIEKTEKLFIQNPLNPKLNLKNIICRRDKNKQSIRVVGNDGYRILLTKRDEITYFQDIMSHDKYDRLTKDC